MADLAPQIDYEALEEERSLEITADLENQLVSQVTTAYIDSLGQHILRLVVERAYDRAKAELAAYIEQRTAYPKFQDRTRPYIQHCHDLIHAIETKRDFPNLSTLPISKQQEMMDRVRNHFDELKGFLKKIEGTERDARMDDMRSTVWFVKSLSYSGLTIAAVAFFLELQSGLLATLLLIFDDSTFHMMNWLSRFF